MSQELSWSSSFEAPYISSTVIRNSLTMVANFSSAGPATNCKGLTSSGRIGRVELGTMCGIRLAAGRSYHGVEGSPCMAGMTKGGSFEGVFPTSKLVWSNSWRLIRSESDEVRNASRSFAI